MEVLTLLEKRITDLVELTKKLKSENCSLMEENKKLLDKVDALETAVLKDREDLDQEKELTKLVVDGLLKNIDSLVEETSSN